MRVKLKYSWEDIKRSSKTKDGILALYIYRKVAHVVTFFFANFTGVSPNYVTFLALTSWLSAALLIFYGYSTWAAFFIFFGFVLDCTDGNIARLKRQTSRKGKLYDMISDRVGSLSIWIALGVVYFYKYSNPFVLILEGLLITVTFVFDMLRYRFEERNKINIHDTSLVNSYELKIKATMKKFVPFINWDNVVLGVGADLIWTLLLVSSLYISIFPAVLLFLLFLEIFSLIVLIKTRSWDNICSHKKTSNEGSKA